MNKRQERFVTEYLIDLNATQAAIRAGYSERTARSQGQRLLTKADIQEAVQKAQEKIQDENIASAKDVLEFLSLSMNGEVDEEALLVVGDGDGFGKVVRTRKEMAAKDRIKAAELIGKRYALFTDKVDLQTGDIVIEVGDWDVEEDGNATAED